MKNYRPISLYSLAGRIFERVTIINLFNATYEFFTENNLISPDQLHFKPSDSCINQLLIITQKIYTSHDLEV